jgi:multiple sugar transport system ATP-binding protein
VRSLELGEERLPLADEVFAARPGLEAYDGRTVIVGMRPEDVEDAEFAREHSDECQVPGQMVLRESLGSEVMAHFTVGARPALTDDVRELAQEHGDHVRAAGDASADATLVGRFDPRTRAQEGQAVTVALHTRSMHFFDPETNLAIYDRRPSPPGEATT